MTKRIATKPGAHPGKEHSYRLPPAWFGKRLGVLVVGAGGTGSAVLASLAQIAVALPQLGHPGLDVTVMDDDTVSASNVGRQLFTLADIGRPKAAVLVNRINLAYGLSWSARTCRLTDDEDGREVVMLGCVDSRKARAVMARRHAAKWDDNWWIDCGNTASSGQVILGARRNNEVDLPSVADLLPEAVDENADVGDDAPSCSMAEALSRQDLLVNRFMADAATNLLWQLLRYGQVDSHGAFIDVRRFTMRPLPVDADCWARMGWRPGEAAPTRRAA